MGWRFRKSKKIMPGVRLNIGKNSIGFSFGGKGFRYSINSKGRRTVSAGVPGTGLSYSKSSCRKQIKKIDKAENPFENKFLNKYVYIIALSLIVAFSSFFYATTFIGVFPLFVAAFLSTFSLLTLIDGVKERKAIIDKSGEYKELCQKELHGLKIAIFGAAIALTLVFIYTWS